MDTPDTLIVVAVVLNAMLVGAGLDQHIKQLPARHRIGVVAFSEYSKAADLRNGVAWYASLGIGSALATLAAAVVGLLDQSGHAQFGHAQSGHAQSGHAQDAAALWCAIAFTVVHSVITSRVAPLNFSQRRAAGDPDRLAAIFDRFARWSIVRVTFQVLALLAMVWALVVHP